MRQKAKIPPAGSIFALPSADNIKGVRKWSRRRNFRKLAGFLQVDGIFANWHDAKISPSGCHFCTPFCRQYQGSAEMEPLGGIFAVCGGKLGLVRPQR